MVVVQEDNGLGMEHFIVLVDRHPHHHHDDDDDHGVSYDLPNVLASARGSTRHDLTFLPTTMPPLQ